VMITCSTAGVVVFYDDEVGNLTAQISGVGLQPYALAVDLRNTGGARVYVTNFTDGRVTVIDVPDLSRPASAKIVAFLGTSQLCITRGVNEQTSCDGGAQ
jgi:YVTN family beta-propeller protein